jgi:outer membrane lipoprotein-sorting protein
MIISLENTKMLNKLLKLTSTFIFLILLVSGCSSLDDIDEDMVASSMSIEDIELKKNSILDPNGRYKKAKTSSLKQMVTTKASFTQPKEESMVEVKFQHPDKFKLTTYKDNQIAVAIIVNGPNAWMADYNSKKISILTKEQFKKISVIFQLSNPANKIVDIFDKIKVYESSPLVTDINEQYYKLVCSKDDLNPINLYLDKKSCLPRRIKAIFNINNNSIEYDSTMKRYSLYEGVMIPDESIVEQDGITQESKVLHYKLDIKFPDNEFLPPVF